MQLFVIILILCVLSITHVMYDTSMPMTNYRRTLADAKRDLVRLLGERQKIDHKLARLQGVINHLETLCDELNHKVSGKRMTKEELRMGFTDLARVILRENFFPLTANDLKETMEAKGVDFSDYSNPLAVTHTVLKRLVRSGEVRMVPQKKGKNAYQWITPTDKLLSELRESGQPTLKQRGGVEGSK